MSNVRREIGDNPTVTVQSLWLKANRWKLRADVLDYPRDDRLAVSPEELERVILLGRDTILRTTEEFYHEQVAKMPGYTISRPSIWTTQLGTTPQSEGPSREVFTDKGYANGGLNTFADETQPEFTDYWLAISNAGFIPEVRRTSTYEYGGTWLTLRKPTPRDVLREWYGVEDDQLHHVADFIKDEDALKERKRLVLVRSLGERAVDRGLDMLRSREQIGLILYMAALKLMIGNREGYEEELSDAQTYADNDPTLDISTARAIENSAFELEQTGDE